MFNAGARELVTAGATQRAIMVTRALTNQTNECAGRPFLQWRKGAKGRQETGATPSPSPLLFFVFAENCFLMT